MNLRKTPADDHKWRVTVMSEREWELYRLSLAERMPESAYKTALIRGIKNKLKMLEMEASSAKTVKTWLSARQTTLLRAA
jgi:hypothetical protein